MSEQEKALFLGQNMVQVKANPQNFSGQGRDEVRATGSAAFMAGRSSWFLSPLLFKARFQGGVGIKEHVKPGRRMTGQREGGALLLGQRGKWKPLH